MNLDRIIHPLVDIPNTDDTTYDKWGRVSEVRKNGLWNLKNHKDLKNNTPDGDLKDLDNLPMFMKGDLVHVNCKSLYGSVVDGDVLFDSYDTWDNTCYISVDGITKWMKLSDLVFVKRKGLFK
jgi:hypothetical protein